MLGQVDGLEEYHESMYSVMEESSKSDEGKREGKEEKSREESKDSES